MIPCTMGESLLSESPAPADPSHTSVRGPVALAPDNNGHRSRPSTGGRPAAAARASVGSMPASPQNVVYLPCQWTQACY